MKKIPKKILNDTNNEVAESIISNKEMIEGVSRAAPIGIGIVINRVLIFVNDFLCDMLEYSREELIGKSSRIAYPTDEDYDYVGKEKYHQMEKSKTGTVETRFKTKSGKIINVILSSSYLDKDNPSKGAIFTALDITDRKNIEDELINTQKSLKTFIDGVPESILLMNKNGIVIEANDTVSKRLEIPRDKIIGSCIYNLVDRETSSRRKEYAKWVISSKLPLRIEDIRSDRIIENNLYPILDENNEVSHIAIIGYDITEKKKNEEILRLSEDKFRTFFENNTEYCYMVSPDKEILNANKAALKALGYEKEELIGKSLSTIYSPESFEKMNQLFQKWRETGHLENEEMTIISKSGEKRIVLLSSSAVKDQNGSLIHSISMQRDITEIKKIENQLKESEKHYRLLFESVQAGVIIQSISGKIIHANKTATEIFRLPKEDILGKTSIDPVWNMILEDGTPVKGEDHPSMITVRTGKPMKDEIRGIYANDPKKIRWLKINTEPIFEGKANSFQEVLITFDDITDLKKSQDIIKESEEKYRTLYEHMNTCVAIYGPMNNGNDFVIKGINKAGEEKSKVKFEEIKGKSVVEVFPSVKEMGLFDVFKRVYKTGKPEYHPTTLYKDNRMSQWVENYVFRLSSGEIVAMYDDVSERKIAEELLKDSEEKFRTFFERNPSYSYIMSPEGSFIDLNQAALNALGYEKKELLGKHRSLIYPPESLPKMREIFEELEKTGYIKDKEVTIITKNGEKRVVLISSLKVMDTNGNWISSISIHNDITERKKAEEAVRLSEEKFRSIFESTADIITYTDCYGNILDTNSKVKDILGFEREEIIGKNFRDLKLIDIEEIPSLIKLFIKTISIGRALDKTEIALRNNKGDKVYFEIATQFIKKNKKVIGAVSIFRDITERNRMIEAVRESEEKFRSIFDSAQDAIFIINKEDRLIDANEKASKIFGYTKEEILNMFVTDFQAPEVRGTPGTVIKSELEKYKWNTFEALDIDKFGNKISVEISQSLFNLKGEEVIINIVRDISQRKKMEGNIRDSEMHYRSLFENSPIALWEEDYSLVKKEIDNLKESGIKDIREYLENNMDFVKKCVPLVKIIDFNASVLKLYNAKDKTEYLSNLSNVFSESSVNMFKEAMICIAEGKRELIGEDKNYTVDKKEIDVLVNWRVVPGHENNYDKVYVSDLDITPNKRAQEAIKQSEEKYRRIVDTSNEGIWAVDENRITTFVNLKMTEMLGYSSEEMLGKSFESFVFKEDLPDAINRIKLRAQGISEVYERNYKKKDGSELPAIVSATPIIDENGNFKGSFVMVTDISERKRFEDTIKQLNDNLKLLNKILRHDISNDLTVVSLSLEMLETKDEDIRNKAFNAIKRSVDLIEKIRVLESTMDKKYTLKQVNTKKVLDFIKKTYPHIKINISGECNLLADEAFMSVIDNIVNNAITHGKTGKIDIEITPDENICQMKIIDHGKGIPDSIKSKIFEEEFSYGESRGTGLGLYISKKNIERYGGTMEVKDTKPHGATFIIKLKTCEL